MKILLTGFDPFGGESINPSSLCINSLPDNIDDIEIKKITLPTVFKDSSRVLEENIASFSPNIVICVGQAGETRCSIKRWPSRGKTWNYNGAYCNQCR